MKTPRRRISGLAIFSGILIVVSVIIISSALYYGTKKPVGVFGTVLYSPEPDMTASLTPPQGYYVDSPSSERVYIEDSDIAQYLGQYIFVSGLLDEICGPMADSECFPLIRAKTLTIQEKNSTKEKLGETDKTEEEYAIDLVQELPEVQEWMKLFSEPNGTSPITGGTTGFAIDSGGSGLYTVHVYENLPERIVTFGWYEVNTITGGIEKVSMP